MLKYCIVFIICILSFLLTPTDYSLFVNGGMLSLYVLLFYFLIKDSKDKNYFNFNILFSISFLFTCFIYPVFFYLTNTNDIPFFMYGFDEKVINKSTIYALMGYNFYCIGSYKNRNTNGHNFNIYQKKYSNKVNIILLYVFFILFLQQAGVSTLVNSNYGGSATWGGVARYIFFLVIALLWISVLVELNNKKKNTIFKTIKNIKIELLIFIFIYTLFFMIVGNRANIISLYIIIVGYITLHVKKMSGKFLVFIVLCGFFLLSLMAVFRMSKENPDKTIFSVKETSLQSFLGFGSDLIISNYTLYLLVEDCNKNGYNYGHSMLGPIFGTFPFMISSYLSLSGDKEENLTSSLYITSKVLGKNSDVGLGTNLIGDLYLSFGIFGICFGMYFLGFLVNRFRLLSYSGNLFYNIIYLALLSWSVMLPRAEYFVYLRGLIWALFIFSIIVSLQKYNRGKIK